MRILSSCPVPFDKLLGSQAVLGGVRYRPSNFTLPLPVDEGTVLYSTLTKAMTLLGHDEAAGLTAGNIPEELIRDWFYVPEDFGDNLLAREMRTVARAILPDDPPITSYVIFTTTDCNARCFYCYQKGRPRIAMSERTALEAVSFIERRSRGNKVLLNWFGGEPLHNKEVITIICTELGRKGIAYSSSMVSNAFLFDGETISQAKDEWGLTEIQVTLDGTEEISTRRKPTSTRG